ncbi:MAG: GAF domain-containing protein [Bacteroidales bacterium]
MNTVNKVNEGDDGPTMLMAIRKINQLAGNVTNTRELVRHACDLITAVRGVSSAWIALTREDGTLMTFEVAGLKGDPTQFIHMLEQGSVPDCMQVPVEDEAGYVIRQNYDHCGDCVFRFAYPEAQILTTKINFQSRHLGYLTVSVSGALLENSGSTGLFVDIAEDIGLAIATLEQSEKNNKSVKEIMHAMEEWEKTFDAIPDLIAIIDTDHRIVKANKAMAEKLGCSVKSVGGCHCFEVVHGMDTVPEFCPHSRSLQSKIEEHSDLVEYRQGGFYDVTTTPIFGEGGELIGSVHVARDVTARKKIEELLAENLSYSEFALKQPMNALIKLAIDKAELLTRSKIGFFHFVDEDETTISLQNWSTNTLKQFCTAAASEVHYPLEVAGIWADCAREKRPVIHNNYSAHPDRKGLPEGHAEVINELTVPIIRGDKVVAIIGVGNKPDDYDDKDVEIVSQLANLAWEYIISKRFEEALFKSEQHAHALLDAFPDLIFRISRTGKYLYYKGAIEDLSYQQDTIVGKFSSDMLPAAVADLIDSNIKLVLEQKHMVLFEYQLDVPGKGLRDFEARMVPSGPDEVTAVSRDITERKKTELALKKKVDQLEWFNHMMIDRELKMIELKKEINSLSDRLGEGNKYVIHQKKEVT